MNPSDAPWHLASQCLFSAEEERWIIFRSQLEVLSRGKEAPKRWYFFVAYDQLHLEVGPWRQGFPKDHGLVFVESTWKPNQRPYHKQKLAFLLTSMRHFAIEAASHGHPVVYLAGTRAMPKRLVSSQTSTVR